MHEYVAGLIYTIYRSNHLATVYNSLVMYIFADRHCSSSLSTAHLFLKHYNYDVSSGSQQSTCIQPKYTYMTLAQAHSAFYFLPMCGGRVARFLSIEKKYLLKFGTLQEELVENEHSKNGSSGKYCSWAMASTRS